MEEYKSCQSACFLTLTYDNDHELWGWKDEPVRFLLKDAVNQDDFSSMRPILDISDIQLFIKKLRKVSPGKLVYYCVGEYGKRTARPHWHMILFNFPVDKYEKISEIWGKGFIDVGSVTEASIRYTLSYMKKSGYEIVLMSRRPGIGFDYIERMKDWHKEGNRFYRPENGLKMPLPKYYRDKIFAKRGIKQLKQRKEVIKKQTEKEQNEFQECLQRNEDYWNKQIISNEQKQFKTKAEKL